MHYCDLQSINTLFKENKFNLSTLKIIQQHAMVLIKINKIIINQLPHELKSCCRIANYRQRLLIVEVANASQKIRLKYELPMLFSKLSNSILPSLSSIKIIINPLFLSKNSINYLFSQQTYIKPSKQNISKLNNESIKIIRDLANRSPQKLKHKLEQLIISAKKNNKKNIN